MLFLYSVAKQRKNSRFSVINKNEKQKKQKIATVRISPYIFYLDHLRIFLDEIYHNMGNGYFLRF